jgi:hypothetical protein
MSDQVMLPRAVVEQVAQALDIAQSLQEQCRSRHHEKTLAAYHSMCDALAQQQAEPQWCACEPTRCEGMGRCRWQAMKYVPPAQQQAEPKQKPEPFVIKHYSGDERPILKGNGFDGLGIGDDREEAELFVTWVNARITAQKVEPVSSVKDSLTSQVKEQS